MKSKLYKYIEEMKELYDVISSIIESTDELENYFHFVELQQILDNLKIRQNKQKLKLCLTIIVNISNNHYRSEDLFNKIKEILNIINGPKNTLNQTFSNMILFKIFLRNKKLLLFLFQKEIIKVDQNIVDSLLEEDQKQDNSYKYCHFFYPEVKKFLSEEKSNAIKKELPIDFDEKRETGENESYICELIRNDSVEKFIQLINKNCYSLNSTINQSIFETNPFLIENNKQSLIEYAAFFGSIKIFNYLRFSDAEMKDTLWLNAIHGNNPNMIHLLESLSKPTNDQYKEYFFESIKCHHNDIANYLLDNYLGNNFYDTFNEEEKEKVIRTILQYSNYYYLNILYENTQFLKEIERNFVFYYLCKYEQSKIIRIFLKTKKQEIENRIMNAKSEKKLLKESADENKIYIIYYLLSKQKKVSEKTFEGCKQLIYLSIPPTIKSIGENSFHECKSLKRITIPSSVTSIKRCSFDGCKSLEEINFPPSINSIEEYSFRGCSSLQTIIIPSNVKYIGSYAFDECKKLKTITIPKKLKKIGEGAFYGCSLLDGISLPESITEIGSRAFYGCSSLKKIEIPKGISRICKGLMRNCESIIEITIPKSIKVIESFSFCDCKRLKKVTFEEASSLTEISKSSFKGCFSLTQISIPPSVTSIGDSAFYGCSSLTTITIPSFVNSIGDNVFEGCSSLQEIAIPSSVINIGKGVFRECSSLTEIIIPSSVTVIRSNTFNRCSSLKKITFPSSLTEIGSDAFRWCSSLEQISIPSSLTWIGRNVFNGCKSLKQIILPPSITRIYRGAFYRCSSLEELSIPPTVTSIGGSIFSGCSNLKKITIQQSQENRYGFYDDKFFIKDKTKLIWVMSNDDSIIIPSFITHIKHNVFDGSTFKRINLSSVKTIGNYAFQLSSLEEITIPSSITSIGEYAFRGCLSLTKILFEVSSSSNSNISLKDGVFYGCTSITQITIPTSVTRIGNEAFYGCTSLARITIPTSVTRIGNEAFYGCTSLTRITIPSSVESIGDDAFKECSSLVEISKSSSLDLSNVGLDLTNVIIYHDFNDFFKQKFADKEPDEIFIKKFYDILENMHHEFPLNDEQDNSKEALLDHLNKYFLEYTEYYFDALIIIKPSTGFKLTFN